MLDGFHLRVANILGCAIESSGFALGGGYGLQAHGITDRPSEDLDFYSASMDPSVFQAAEASLLERLSSAGLTAEIIKEEDWFRGVYVTDPNTGEQVVVDLAYDYREKPPVRVAGVGPVLDIEDIVLGKVRAFVDRATERDYVDIDGILRDGRWSPRSLYEMVEPIRPELSWKQFSDLLRTGHEQDPTVYARLGVAPQDLTEMFSRLRLASQAGAVYVEPHMRAGKAIRGHWRSHPSS